MSGKIIVTLIAVSTSITMVLPTISAGANLEVQQEGYLYQMPYTQNVYTETFVISPITTPHIEKGLPSESIPASPAPVAYFTNPITVYFQIDSPEVSSEEYHKILSQLRYLGVPQNTPLVVTGFTCQKGPDEYNFRLSNERAIAVAKLLRKHSYTVAKIEGKGESNLVSESYYPFNRRVEIEALKK